MRREREQQLAVVGRELERLDERALDARAEPERSEVHAPPERVLHDAGDRTCAARRIRGRRGRRRRIGRCRGARWLELAEDTQPAVRRRAAEVRARRAPIAVHAYAIVARVGVALEQRRVAVPRLLGQG